MKEIEKQGFKRIPFSFVCPVGKEEEAFVLFEDLSLGTLDSNYKKGTRTFINPNNGGTTEVSGYILSGITDVDKINLIIKELSSQKIAGYSRETQIFFEFIPKEKD